MILEGHPILLLPIAYCNRAIVEIFYLVPPVGKLKVLPNKDLRRLSSGKNASSLIVQSSKSCLLPFAFCMQASCLLPLASCLTKPTNGLFQEALFKSDSPDCDRMTLWSRKCKE